MSNVSNTTMLSYASRINEPELSKSTAAKAEGNNAPSTITAVKQPDTAAEVKPEQSPQALEQALDVINRAIVIEQRSLSFSVDEASGRSVIKVVDQQTDQLIRQIPTEEVLRVAQDIKKLQEEMGQSLGLLIDRKV